MALAFASAFPATAIAQSAGSGFARIQLAHDVSIELPINWTVLSENSLVTIEAYSQAALAIETLVSDLQFAANLYGDDGETLALANVRFYPDLDVRQADARALSGGDIEEMNAMLEEQFRTSLEPSGMAIQTWAGTERREINGVTAFVTDYSRSSVSGPDYFRVRLVRVFDGERSFTVTVSYATALGVILLPITDRIIASIVTPLVDSTAAPRGLSSDVISWVALLPLLVTWAIVLTPPLVIRYRIVAGPLSRAAAAGVVGVFWFLNVLFFSATAPTVVAVGVVFSYAILRRPLREKPEVEAISNRNGGADPGGDAPS